MTEFLQNLQFWHWWSLAVLLGIIEILVPGVFFIWLAAAALLNGLVILIFSPGWEYQIMLFAAFSVGSLFLWHRIGRKNKDESTHLNRRGEQMIGRNVILIDAIVNGRGSARLNDSVWRVEGEDMPAGTSVIVTGVDGTILKVKKIKSSSHPNG